jgi:hypothetical protein
VKVEAKVESVGRSMPRYRNACIFREYWRCIEVCTVPDIPGPTALREDIDTVWFNGCHNCTWKRVPGRQSSSCSEAKMCLGD